MKSACAITPGTLPLMYSAFASSTYLADGIGVPLPPMTRPTVCAAAALAAIALLTARTTPIGASAELGRRASRLAAPGMLCSRCSHDANCVATAEAPT
ncbi:Uncharacterised protein [Mycobacterium tuberculosis]|uniref:Uncharacterized protein n=1 Tax=Mycobacterium tuberculosis TaxID=1773 RepID=A0A655AA31_MYCTX|nr:Uncharacterised protein [Mycobacterium tuberculosis]CKO27476.1 Uncharacterised protein [Mycobacterium tuberculosis]CKQ73196.1 Uncharacterised protein [Mycobacterium tuberculosis]CKR31858.1 Uncharacterised protein [Mycobacterium tuberculosis]CKS35277.1 Uncharacterised protein [Mycobacterium tuberculosis]